MITPAMGTRMIEGPKAARKRSETDVTSPVSSNINTMRAKKVMPEPIRDATWPDQMTV